MTVRHHDIKRYIMTVTQSPPLCRHARALLYQRWMGPFKVLSSPTAGRRQIHTAWTSLPRGELSANLILTALLRPSVHRPAQAISATRPALQLPSFGSASARGGGGAQVQDALRQAPRSGAVDRPRRVCRHMGAAGEPDVGPSPPPFPRQGSPSMLHPRGTLVLPGGARRPTAALLVAGEDQADSAAIWNLGTQCPWPVT
jgi:hypothetical protein